MGESLLAQHEDAPTQGTATVDIRELYRRGDPLRFIAAAKECSTEEVSLLVLNQTDTDDELERSRAIRRRCLSTNEIMLANEAMIERLYGSGIDRDEIPKVLKALGISIDIQIAAELLHIPGIPGGQPVEEVPSPQIGDKLSLLYIAGIHHKIEPDYQLALGKMSLAAVSKLRGLLNSRLPYRRMAEILAIIETTALAIRARTISTLSYADYKNAMEATSRRLGSIANDAAEPWPVPADKLRTRYGSGSWESALRSVGMRLIASDHRFSGVDYLETLDHFTEECIDLGIPMNVELYDQWIIAAAAVKTECPSAVEVIRHYGSWDEAIEAVLPQEEEEEEGDEEPYSHESYWGFPFGLEDESLAINEAKSQRVAEEWHKAGKLIGQLLAKMPWNSFLRVEYDGNEEITTRPYAQATPSADGVWCEIVSEQYLPAAEWPINRRFLTNNGWVAPDDEVPNWLKARVPLAAAGHEIVSGLRHGRSCTDAKNLRWSTGEFPSGPGPEGGVTIERALEGEVQTLRNAS
ncbi:TY-Chap domain-containing protein [Arthrobacter sp. PvP023]